MFTETLAQAVDRLTAEGYTDGFRAELGGLRALAVDVLYQPEELSIGEVVRFEGSTDPADEAIVLALHCEKDGVKGTYAAAYGPATAALDAEMIRRLPDTTTRRGFPA